jgi:mono/diheme cytochrome c family protein
MREDLARWIALLSAAVAVAMAIAFAMRQNPPDALRGGVEAPAVSPPLLRELRAEAGRAIYEAQNCSMCHSVAGAGNPRSPLDRVGARLDRAELQRWTVGDPALADRLPAGVLRMKQSYAQLDADEMETLIDYLQSLGH